MELSYKEQGRKAIENGVVDHSAYDVTICIRIGRYMPFIHVHSRCDRDRVESKYTSAEVVIILRNVDHRLF